MKLTFDVSATEFAKIRDILMDTLPSNCRVWVFGSRAKNTARFNSDLDLALEASQGRALPKDTLPRLKDAFNDAPLSYRVDMLDLREVSDDFQAIIRKQAVAFPLLQTGNIPKIRFREFSEPWKTTVLSKIATFSKGKGISKSDIDPKGNTYCIRYGELYTTYDTIIDKPVSKTWIDSATLNLSEGGEVIVPASGEDAKDIATAAVVLRAGIALGGDLNIIRSPFNGAFLASYLSGKKRMALAAMAQGISVVHLYPAQLGSINLGVTCRREQDKIASFLGATDKKITQLIRKKTLLEDYKKGCMQKLFSQEIRFKDDQGNVFPGWEERRLGSVANIIGGGTPNSQNKEYWKGDIHWFTPSEIKSKYLSTSVRTITSAGLRFSSAKMLPIGTLLLSTRATVGDVGIAKQECCTNQGFQSLEVKGENYNEFWYYWILMHKKELLRRASGSTFLEIGKSEISKIPVACPSPKEQLKIADFLSAIDTKIDLVGQVLGHAQAFKKGLLQQMFV